MGNTRGRDFYDAYLLLSANRNSLIRLELLHAINVKDGERGSIPAIENQTKILEDIADSPDIAKIWENYKKRYHYAKGIDLPDILALITWVFEGRRGPSANGIRRIIFPDTKRGQNNERESDL